LTFKLYNSYVKNNCLILKLIIFEYIIIFFNLYI